MNRVILAALLASGALAQTKLDPAAWGSNHVGKPTPEFVSGDECLFCHRNDIGPGWQKNAHGIAVRQLEDAPELVKRFQPLPPQVGYFLGSRNHIRYLKKDGYNKFAIFSEGKWLSGHFTERCAGCHTTAVDPKTGAFAAFGHDCYTCHGAVSLEHTADTSQILLSKKRRGETLVVTSICAQCHLREGKSKSTGLPWPNNFVAGDNLFKDYEVDFARAEAADLNPGDRHIVRNVRDVVVNGSDVTCVSCHRVHTNSTRPHRLVLTSQACQDCHNAGGPKKNVKKYEVHSARCEY